VFRTDIWRLALVAVLVLACRRHREVSPATEQDDDRDEATEEHEESEQHHLNYWRVQITIVGSGSVDSAIAGLVCTSDGQGTRGNCGPKLLTFEELRPPLLHATPSPGWRLARWESVIRSPGGATRQRPPPMPDGAYYLDGFGYSDTHETEAVTAVFVPVVVGPPDAQRSSPP
jgi:hypothetical protein